MQSNRIMTKPLDQYEADLEAAYEGGAFVSINNGVEHLSKFKAAATATFIKDKRINIRLSSPDLMDIQEKAMEQGMPYQTFIASVLHQFASGRLVVKTP
jgi:predicted DNA binding CopG/RHH family protein